MRTRITRFAVALIAVSLTACGGRNPTFEDVPFTETQTPPTETSTDDAGNQIVTENFSVTESKGSADILFVIDNSGSMQFEQRNMADRFKNMIDLLKGIDWQVAITTTETGGIFSDGGRLLPFQNNLQILDSSLDMDVADQLFRQTIQRSEVGDDTERGITAVKDAIDRIGDNTANTNFFRTDSHLAVVIISDEDESFEFFDRTSANELVSKVENQWSGQKSFAAHSIITKPDDRACLNSNGATYGREYAKLSSLTGGIIGSVCEADYAKQLADIGKSVVFNSVPALDLKCEPIDKDGDGIIDVQLDGEMLGEDEFLIDGDTIMVKTALDLGDYELVYYCAPEGESN